MKKENNLINEVFWLRCIACLAVTLGHAVGNGYALYTEPSIYNGATYVLSMAVLFGVPVFIFISEFLLANKYLEKVPKGFLKKRMKVLLIPYLFMNTVYAIVNVEAWSVQEYFIQLAAGIFLGKSAVYFIIIIFQFYLLHIVIRKYLNRWSPKVIIPVAFMINFLYLALFNFMEPPNNSVALYIWDVGYWLPFIGWIFYFVLGFYTGKNYQAVLKILRGKWVFVLPVIGLSFMLMMNKLFLIQPDSKRIGMLIYGSSIIFLIMYISAKVKKVPKIVMFISNYSFSIFLLNMLFFVLLRSIQPPDFLNILSYALVVFLLTLVLCIITSRLFNEFRIGKYLVGQVMPYKVKHTQSNRRSVKSQIS